MMNRNTILTPYFLDQPLPGLDELQRPGWIINQLPLPGYQLIKRIAVLQAALARYVEEALAEEGFSGLDRRRLLFGPGCPGRLEALGDRSHPGLVRCPWRF